MKEVRGSRAQIKHLENNQSFQSSLRQLLLLEEFPKIIRSEQLPRMGNNLNQVGEQRVQTRD